MDELPKTHHRVFHVETSAEEAVLRDGKRALVEETRRLMEEVSLFDAASSSEEDMQRLAQRVRALADEVAAEPSLRPYGGMNGVPGFASALDERSPISGQSNPVAAPLHLWRDGELTRGTATYGAVYEGPPQSLHGGIVAGAFDELFGVCQIASGRPGMTGTLTIRMRRPTPLCRPIEYVGGVSGTEGRKIFVWGRSEVDGELLVEAEGVMITPRDLSRMM